jgi:hypothetical protein
MARAPLGGPGLENFNVMAFCSEAKAPAENENISPAIIKVIPNVFINDFIFPLLQIFVFWLSSLHLSLKIFLKSEP